MVDSRESVCAVVVTYNRKQLLLNCLEALRSQTRPVDAIYIIDNASTDGTPELLMEKGYIKELPPKDLKEPWETESEMENLTDGSLIKLYYVRMHKNAGGSGGFYEGVKRGYERGYDWLWLMDDDGLPENDCLSVLLKYKNCAHYIGPVVLRIDKPEELAFSIWLGSLLTSVEEVKSKAREGVIEGIAFPCNGILISKALIRKVGYPKRELFIWGDEIEYFYRAMRNGFKIILVVDAVHYHPKFKGDSVKIFMNKFTVDYTPNALRSYCLYRNRAYVHRKYLKLKDFIKDILKYSWFFIFTRRVDIKGFIFFVRATIDGLLGIWGKEERFINKPMI